MRSFCLIFFLFPALLMAQSSSDLYGEAVRAYYAQDYSTALQKYSAAIALKPKSEVYVYSRAKTYQKLNNDTAAENDFRKVVNLDSNYIDAWYELGLIKMGEKQYDTAFRYFNHVLKINKNDVKSLHQIGLIWYYKRQNGYAIETFDRLIRIDSTDDQAYYKRGLAEFNMEDFDAAVADFTEVYRLDPDNTLALEQRATTYMRLNDLERACLDWTVLLKRNNPRAKDSIAKYCSKD